LKSNLISKSETAQVIKEISSQWKIDLPKIKNLKFHYFDDDIIIISGGGLKAIKTGESYLPFLTETQILKKFPYIETPNHSVFLSRSNEIELIQYRNLVGCGPSSNTCPRCAPQFLHITSVLTIPELASDSHFTFSSLIGL